MTSETIAPMMSDSASTRKKVLESLPVDPSLLESANIWFDRSWYGLLICGAATAVAAMATVAFLFLQYWSSGVRERHTEWRTSVLELRTAESNERAKASELKLEELRRKVAPRHINFAQFKADLESKPKSPVEIMFTRDDGEAFNLSFEIMVMLHEAGWEVERPLSIPTTDDPKLKGYTSTMAVGGQATGVSIVAHAISEEEFSRLGNPGSDTSFNALKNALEGSLGRTGQVSTSVHSNLALDPGKLRIVVGTKL